MGKQWNWKKKNNRENQWSWFLERTKNIDQTLARLIRKQKEETQINNIENERYNITADSTDTKRKITSYYEQHYVNELVKLSELDNFLEGHKL